MNCNAGSQMAFSSHVKSVLVEALAHDSGLTLYRTTNTVHKCANLIVHVFLCELLLWMSRHGGRFPDIVYMGADGGSENSNRTVLGTLELLVVKRLVLCSIFTRLPSQHSHGDDDGAFGLVKNATKRMPMLHWEDFPNQICELFSGTKLKATVVDVHMVNDWHNFTSPHIDSHLKNLHKLEETQLQWMYTAVEPSPWFPIGVRTQYRAHAQDITIEGHVVEKLAAKSSLGGLTGIDFHQIFSPWYPNENTFPERNQKGFFLLTSIPCGTGF